jgi:ribonuclease D
MDDAGLGHDYRYLADQAAFDAVAPLLRDAPTLAIDTESDSLYRYRERVCFVQIGVGREALLVDTLAVRDLTALADACANPAQTKILHGADYDVSCLRRDFGFAFDNLFDTMIAAQLVGREQLGLAALVREFFGVELDKSLTTHDWGRRPLEPKYVRYLADDVVYLETIRENLLAELERVDALEEAGLEFRRVSAVSSSRGVFDPEAFRRVKGARDLNQTGLAVLKALCAERDRLAEAEDRPPFKIVGNQALIDVACSLPKTLDALRRIQGFSDYVLRKIGPIVLDAVRRGEADAPNVPLRVKPAGPRPSDERLAADDALRAWRKEAAARDGRTTMLVLPNYLLERAAAALPKTVEELAAIDGLGRKRLARYGAEIVAITRNPPPLDEARARRRGGLRAVSDGDAAD